MSDPKRLMPDRLSLGEHMNTTVISPLHNWENSAPDPYGRRTVMGYPLPDWQRGLVWTEAQSIRLIESLWLGMNIGTFTVNYSPSYSGRLDRILIDGQQRMWALEQYLSDAFPVFGYRWGEVTEVDRRAFTLSRHFGSYITKSDDEAYLRGYYDLMNFGGVAHTDDQRATAPHQ